MASFTFVGLLVGTAALGAGWSRFSAGRLAKRDADAADFRRRIRTNWVLAAMIFAVVVVLMGADTNLLQSLGIPITGLWKLVSWATVAVGAAVVATISYMGAFPVAKRVSDADVGAAEAVAMVFRYNLYLAGLIVFVIAVVWADLQYHVSGGLVGFGLVLGLVYTFSATLIRLSQTAREPGDRAVRLKNLAARANLKVARFRLLDGQDTRRSDMAVVGPVGRKTLFVTDYLLDTYDDETVVALLAVESARVSRFAYELKLLIVFTPVLLFFTFIFNGSYSSLAALGILGGNLLLTALVIFMFVVEPWLLRRVKLRADDAVTERVGAQTLAAALEATEDEVDHGRAGSYYSFEPTYETRIARLRGEDT